MARGGHSTNTPNFVNRTLYHGDNLDFLRGMNSNCIDLIATDPPFNTGRNRSSTAGSYEDNWKWLKHGESPPDQWSWESAVHEHWLEEVKDDNEPLYHAIEAIRRSHSDGMAAFICFLSVRLLEMRRILKPTGSIFLHCDTTANAYIRMAMDAIFGKSNFRNEIVWWYYNVAVTSKRFFGRKHDTIFWYSKGRNWTFNVDEMRVPYEESSGWFQNSSAYGDDRYSPDARGKLATDVIPLPTINNMAKERTGSPDQKPLALYERVILAGSKPGDWVLDPFCGCATTPIAAEKLKRNWVGIDRRTDAEPHILNRLLFTSGRADNQQFIPKSDEGFDFERLSQARRLVADMGFVFTKVPPVPTDDEGSDVPELPPVAARPRNRFTYDQMKKYLIQWFGAQCWGCDFVAPESKLHRPDTYLELDHSEPASGGGSNEITNRALLCRPCNGRKSDTGTIVGLQKAAGYATGRRQKGTRHPIQLETAKIRIEAEVAKLARQNTSSQLDTKG